MLNLNAHRGLSWFLSAGNRLEKKWLGIYFTRRIYKSCVEFLSALFLVAFISSTYADNIIFTAAGGGPNQNPALLSNLIFPADTAVDSAGNLYIAASSQFRVFRVDASGELSVVAGNGSEGYSGDGGPAVRANLGFVSEIALDAAGDLYIADAYNQRIRKVDTRGIITTVAGNGKVGFYGDGGAATSAKLNYPYGITVDGVGNLYIADYSNNRIRKVDTAGKITTVAGNGTYAFCGDGGASTSACLYGPSGVTVAGSDNLIIVERDDCRIRRVDSGGIITTVVGNGTCGFNGDGGPATGAELYYPWSAAVDRDGNLYIADYLNNRVRKVDAAGSITTVAGNGAPGFGGDGGLAADAELNSPAGVAVDAAGNLYIADSDNDRVRKVDSGGLIDTFAGNGTVGFSGDGRAATDASLYHPDDLGFDTAGNLYILDYGNNRVRRVHKENADVSIDTVVGNGEAGLGCDGGHGIDGSAMAVGVDGTLYLADSFHHRICKVDASGITTVAGNGTPSFCGDGGQAIDACLDSPNAVAVDSAGNLYIGDFGNSRVRMVNIAGIITTVAGTGVQNYSGDGGPATSANIDVAGLAVDGAGGLFLADSMHNRIRKVANGIITTVAGNGTGGFCGDGGPATDACFNGPNGVTVDGNGNLFIADYNNDRVRKVDVSGIVTTVAGNGIYGFSGDGGPATAAEFTYASGMAVDAAGDLFIADFYNDRVRCVSDANEGLCSDTAPPSITVPADIIAAPNRASGAVVSYPPAVAVDNVDPSPVVSYSQGSSTLFPFGTTTVMVTAADARGNSSAASFTVTVQGADPGTVSCHGLTPTMVGTNNRDVIHGTAGPDIIAGLGGNDVIYGLGGDDIICGGDGADVIYGGDGNDILDGDSGNDKLIGENGNDMLNGGDGDDYLYGYDGDDVLDGGNGTDVCSGSTGIDMAGNCESTTGVP